MPEFSERSRKNLGTCHEDLQRLFSEVIKHVDCTILCGYRGIEEQDQAFQEGRSRLRFPQSKHNENPSLAVDAVPFPINFNDTRRFYLFAGIVRGIAVMMKISIRCGADWDSDLNLNDQTFHDLGHFELMLTKKEE